MKKKNNMFVKTMCYTLCGAMLLTSPAMSVFASGITETLYSGNTEVAAYITTTPRMMVGDTARAYITGSPNLSTNKAQWYRSESGSYDDAEVITGETSQTYTYTEDDIGYYIFAVVTGEDSEGETVTMKSNITGSAVQEYIEETETWITSTENPIWQYDIIDGLNGLVQIKMVDNAYELLLEEYGKSEGSYHFADITIPSSIDGYSVYKIADDCLDSAMFRDSNTNKSAINSVTISSGIVEIGESTAIVTDKLIIPDSVKYIEKGAIEWEEALYTENSSSWNYYNPIERIVISNPTTHLEEYGIMRKVSSTTNLLGGYNGKVSTTYVGAYGSSIHHIFDEEVNMWITNGLTSPEGRYYVFEQNGEFNATSYSVEYTEEDTLQQKLDANEEEWILSSDGLFYYDIIDGTDVVLVKPAELEDYDKVAFPETLDGYTVGAVIVDSSTYTNVVYDVPSSVMVDRSAFPIANAVIIGEAGSNAEQTAEDNGLVFVNKDVELETREQYDDADKSSWYTSEDGYWQYRFIDGYESVEIQNIKSFGDGATVEVPTEIDGYKVSVYSTSYVATYGDIVIPDGIVTVVGDFVLRTGSTSDGSPIYKAIANNITILDKDIDLSDAGAIYVKGVTTITGYTGSTADLVCVNRIDGTTNADGVLTSTVFIPLDSETELESIVVSGTPKSGNTLTATITPKVATADCQWMISDDGVTYTEIDGETATTLSLTDDMVGKYVKAVATGTGYFAGQIESNVMQVASSTATALTSLTATYYSSVGNTCKASTLKPSGATATYQWYRDTATSSANSTGDIPETAELIEGAIESTYVITAADAGYYLFVTATGTDEYYGTVKAKSSTAVINSNVGTVSIYNRSVQKYVGEELTTTLGTTDAVVTYQWYRADSSSTSALPDSAEAIDGATESTYTLTDDDLGKYVYVVITGVVSEGYGGTALSSTAKVVYAELTSATIDGDAYVGEILTAVTEPEEATATYQWYSRSTNSTSTSGATKLSTEKTYTLTENEVGKYVFCVVTGSGNYSGTAKTNVIGIITEKTIVALDSISLLGTNKVGQTLTATVEPAEAIVDYVWYRANSENAIFWTEITGATSSVYTLTADDEDMYIKVVATGTGDYEGSVEAISSSAIASNLTEITDVTIDGAFKVGETLEVVIEPEEATVDVKWYAADSANGTFTEIGTGNSYTLTEDEEGKYIKVEVVGNGDYTGTKTITSDEAVEAENTITQITKVTVSGSATVGETLTAKVYPSTVSAEIRWLASESEDGDYEEIGTGSTYTLTEDEVGKYIKAEATNSADDSNVVLSSATSAVSAKLTDDNMDEYGRIIDSVERVDYVTEDMDESAYSDIEERDCLVYASQGQEFVVRIPKVIQMSGSSASPSVDFETEVKANISGYDVITVEPDVTSVVMSEKAGIKKDIICDLTIGQTQFSIENDTQAALEAGKVANHTASVDSLTAGEWKGTFNWLITARGKQTTDSEESVE